MASFDKKLKISKTDTYTYTVRKEWLGDETITSHSVYVDTKLINNNSSVIDNVIGVSVTGVAAGGSVVHFEWATSGGRDDCENVILKVIDDC